ncbi:MAG: hypothetical protein ABI119_05875 [Gemmatimonadaceae bacterium]
MLNDDFTVAAVLANLRETEGQWAKGATLFGERGVFEHERKLVLATAACTVRDRAALAGAKVTEGDVDDRAHAATEYDTWLCESAFSREQWLVLDQRRRRWWAMLAALTAMAVVPV